MKIEKERDSVVGTIERIIFKSADGTFIIASLRSKDHGKITIKGNIPTINSAKVGFPYKFQGKWETHKTFGRQLSFASMEEETPSDSYGKEQFLINYIPGLGPIKAKALVEEFGENLFEIIEKNPIHLTRVDGISSELSQKISEEYQKFAETKDHLSQLASWGLSPLAINKVSTKYITPGQACIVIKENPYLLSQDIDGFGFLRADQVASSLNITGDDPRRVQECIVYCLQEATQSGHTFLSYKKLFFGWDNNTGIYTYLTMIEVSEECLFKNLQELNQDRKVDPTTGNIIYKRIDIFELGEDNKPHASLSYLYKAEQKCAEAFQYLSDKEFPEMNVSNIDISDLNEEQTDAIEAIASGKVGLLIITGGAGVGKTYIIQKLIELIKKNGQTFSLMAPTGKAAKRMEEMTNAEAKTIHRYLAYDPITNDFSLPETFDNFIIVDESSMVDSKLMASLVEIMNKEKNRLILVGDKNQLAPVGPGNPFKDAIESKRFFVSELTEIMRQDDDSLIPENANKILRGNKELKFDGEQMAFVNSPLADNLIGIIKDLCGGKSNPGFNLDDIQVISPQHKGPAGTILFNEELQKVYNPNGLQLENFKYKIGDKIVFTKNNYELGYVNGDQGRVIGEDTISIGRRQVKTIIISSDREENILVPNDKIFDLELAYAITIHKSQGSEWPCVILPVHETTTFMLSRSLVYTAVTRGRYRVILVGSRKGLAIACTSLGRGPRFTLVQHFLNELYSIGSIEILENIGQEFQGLTVSQASRMSGIPENLLLGTKEGPLSAQRSEHLCAMCYDAGGAEQEDNTVISVPCSMCGKFADLSPAEENPLNLDNQFESHSHLSDWKEYNEFELGSEDLHIGIGDKD